MKFTITGAIGQSYVLLKLHRKALLKTWLSIFAVMIFADICEQVFASPTGVSGIMREFIYTMFLMQVVHIIISEKCQNTIPPNSSGSIYYWYILICILATPIILFGMFAYDNFIDKNIAFAIFLSLVAISLLHVFCRLLPLLVSVAGGVSKPLSTTWSVTKGHSFRLFAAYLIVLIFRLLPLVFFIILSVVFTIIVKTDLVPNQWLLSLVYDFFLATGAVLSLTFHSTVGLQLLGWRPEGDLLLNHQAEDDDFTT